MYEDDANQPDFSTERSKQEWVNIKELRSHLVGHVEQMDQFIQTVLEKHEYEYMQAYNIYVKNKESEIKQIIDKITERTCDKQANEKKMQRLQNSEQRLREQYLKSEKESNQLKE